MFATIQMVTFWVYTRGYTATENDRRAISQKLYADLRRSGFDFEEGEPQFKPTATSFSTNQFTFDLVFSNSSWADRADVTPPDDSLFRKRPDRQRAVRALKLLSKKNPSAFPRIQGVALERLVIYASQGVDANYRDHVEFSSGLLLFRTCLFSFASENSAKALVDKIQRAVGSFPSSTYQWRLQESVFSLWSEGAKRFLAVMHQKRISSSQRSVTYETMERLFTLPKEEILLIRLDVLNRFVKVSGGRSVYFP
mmetsp:Transcript_37728/g.61149  ORF Transcript_37728/g.61149 Transcript_37728/m.61149 type:complete len:253 (+) Transcript_37728:121-879(+)